MTSPAPPDQPIRGYIEGYYGRLLDWQDRQRIISRLASLGMNAYLYAPKEDPFHRVNWRDPWPDDWIRSFAGICAHAAANGVMLFAGIAPGLDYDPRRHDEEFDLLLAKARSLQSAGAKAIVLMFDDIEAPSSTLDDALADEIALHAGITARLGDHIAIPTMLVPRIYADEISDAATESYGALTAALPADMAVFHCGSHIVAGPDPLAPGSTSAAEIFSQRLILWDNVYCNDYCPRRLFVGTHTGRRTDSDLMLNGTGMVETDILLLGLMAAGDSRDKSWEVLGKAGVPDAFWAVIPWFDKPVMSDRIPPPPSPPDADILAAIDMLLWRWKTPLAREWYPFLFGLKHDLLIAAGDLPELRTAKTQTAALHGYLTGHQGQHPTRSRAIHGDHRDDKG